MGKTNKTSEIKYITAKNEDLPLLEQIRAKAFQPVFDSFRKILGEIIYETAQKPEDIGQKDYLKSLFEEDSGWKLWKVVFEEKIVGFISVQTNEKTKVGEIGLNAIDPDFSGKGIGTEIYSFAIGYMKKEGMKVATVATGGDPSHFPARKAYRKAGFNVEIPSVWMCMELE